MRAGRILGALAALGLGGLARTAEATGERPAPVADERPTAICRIQIGGHVLIGETGLLPSGVPDASEERGGVLGVFALQFRAGSRGYWGLDMDLEGNQVNVGEQGFGIATVRALGTLELPLARHRSGARAFPYGYLDAGWNFNRVGAQTTYVNGAPPGTALGLEMDDGPAVRAGLGLDYEHNAALDLTLDVGWKWNRAGYVMSFYGAPDRTGDFDLSGISLLGGVRLKFPGAMNRTGS